MEFISNASELPTVIALPPAIYSNGYQLSISGTTRYKTETDSKTNTLLIYVAEQSVKVKVNIVAK